MQLLSIKLNYNMNIVAVYWNGFSSRCRDDSPRVSPRDVAVARLLEWWGHVYSYTCPCTCLFLMLISSILVLLLHTFSIYNCSHIRTYNYLYILSPFSYKFRNINYSPIVSSHIPEDSWDGEKCRSTAGASPLGTWRTHETSVSFSMSRILRSWRLSGL